MRKEFKGFGVFAGVVKSYDSPSGFFEIGYEDGDSEEIDFSELAALLEVDGVVMEHSPSLVTKKSSRVGKRPKKRRRVLGSSHSGELKSEVSIAKNLTKKLDFSSNDNNDASTNGENLTPKDVGLNVNSGMHDLNNNGKGNDDVIGSNLDLNNENDEESKLKDLGDDSVKKEQIFDLNMDLDYPENKNQDIDLGGYVKGENSGGNETTNLSSTDHHGTLESGKTRGGKRRKLMDSPKMAAESALRRSARRRAKFSSEVHESSSIKFEGDEHTLPLPLPSPVISAVSEEHPAISVSEESEQPVILPSKLELPPSTGNVNLDGLPLFDLFSVYTFLRSFSTILFLSPFEFLDFVASIRSKSPSLLIDSIHVSLLRTLRKHLELQPIENSTSATNCLRDLNWDLLDSITWPIFMVEYLLLKPEFELTHLKLFKNDYYKQPESLKLKVLHFICDDVVESEAITSELNRRTIGIEYSDFDQPTKLLSIKKHQFGQVVDEKETSDWNSDECCLCKMDGNLICCDGCPAAFHSKCVGIATNLLPPGDWFCPECVVDKKNFRIDVVKAIRGAELLGVDPHGRFYYSTCGYILVSDNCDAESFHYYDMNNLTPLINALELSDTPYETISTAITNHLHSYEKLHGTTFQRIANDDNTLTEKNSSISGAQDSDLEIDYLNLYSFARVASSVVGEWTRKPSEKAPQTPSKSLEELISIQMKSISKTSVDFCWSNIRNLSVDARKEKCGWCLACKFPTDDGNCLFFANNAAFLESFTSDVMGFDSKISRKDRLVDVMCHILCIEDRLHGLLLGPWLNPHFPKLYRKTFLQASHIAPVKRLLLMLELNIRPRVLSDEWLKHVDSVVKVGSASHIVTSKPRIPSRNTIGRKKSQFLDSEPHSSKNAASGLGLFWWRGGRLTRKLFSWKVLPHSLASKAARQGGGKKIEGILYPENSDFPKRTKVLAWRASVESAFTVEQLALQIRELDANIKWEEIENTIHLAKMDKDSLKYMRSFKKAIVRRKSSEGAIVKYLLDFGKRRFIPDTVVKHGSKVEESSNERKKYWVEESYVPLFLLKAFEDKRIALKSNKMSSSKLTFPFSGRVFNSPKKDVFSYLFSKAEQSNTLPCGYCNKDVAIRDAVSCQHCEGFFHKTHVRKTSGGKGGKCTYACHNCNVGDMIKVTPKKKKKVKSKKTKKPLKVTEKRGKGKQVVVPLRRSSRKPKIVSFQSKKNPMKKKKSKTGGRKKKLMKSINEVIKPKGKRGRPRKIKESFRKKRSLVYATYWLNGLLLSRKPDDERVIDFRARNHIPPFEQSDSVADQPKCCLCQELEFRSSLNYVSCVTCKDWYHGDAFGLRDEHISVIIGFKCHKCRERAPPICPHLNPVTESKLVTGLSQQTENGAESGVMCDQGKGILGKESLVNGDLVMSNGFVDAMEVVEEDGIGNGM